MLESSLRRGLGGGLSTAPQYTGREEDILQILALIFASVSIMSTILTVYWFLAMRRGFRHHLIMILIQSDLFKASWFMIYAVAALAPGSVESASIFCQTSGFFTTVGIELSDFSVLMIAVHSALYIFKPPTTIGEGGLYPYRHTAYVLWIVVPLFMASLAFINPAGAYRSGGTSCHLPVRPFWYRLALSWIPRYLIFLFILGIDTSIYFYVEYNFGDCGKNNDPTERQTRSEDAADRRRGEYRLGGSNRRFSLPPTPPLAYNGLISQTRQPSVVPRKAPNLSDSNAPPKFGSKTFSDPSLMRLTKMSFPRPYTVSKAAAHSNVPASVPLTSDVVAITDNSTLETTPITPSSAAVITPVSGILPSTQTSWTNFAVQLKSRSPSRISLIPFLRLTPRNISFSSDASVPVPLELVDSEGQNLNQIYLIETHNKIRQQMRFLFIYPMAYMLMWVLPFISHTLQYNDYYAANPPFVLSALVTVIITSQSAVDCWIFNIKEKPWRQSLKSRGSAVQGLGSFKDLMSWGKRSSQLRGAGKTGAAMAAEARFAYQRRYEERAVRISEIESARGIERRERSWWDEMDDTIGMSPPAGLSVVALVDGKAAAADDAGR